MIFIKNLCKKKIYIYKKISNQKKFLFRKKNSIQKKFPIKKKNLIKKNLFHLRLIDGNFQD